MDAKDKDQQTRAAIEAYFRGFNAKDISLMPIAENVYFKAPVNSEPVIGLRSLRPFIEQVFSLPQGMVSQPFHTTLGWHIVEVTGRKTSRALTFEELKPEIVAWLKNNKRKGILQVFMSKLRRASNIEIYPENI